MYYKNFISRFILRKNLLKRVSWRLKQEWRKLTRNKFDDIKFIFKQLGKEPQTIFDVGANIGYVSFQFRKRFSAANIFSFEPNPTVFSKLSQSFFNDKKVHPINKGVGATNGILNFYKNNNSGTSSFLKPSTFHLKNLAKAFEEIDIEVVNLTDYCMQNSIENVDVLKLDIEGFEIEALKGFHTFLVQKKVDIIYLEVNLSELYENQPVINDVITFLFGYNYLLYGFYGINETAARQTLLTNLLFISDKVASGINNRHTKELINLGKTSFGVNETE
ncbi:MAG: FkbM family methyltransferase [Bacteroidetes bacterium]|nr:FkbM family methyltransferase [Bacteroidota bacterium]